MKSLENKNYRLENGIYNLERQNNYLNQKIVEEEKRKKIERQNFQNSKIAFEKDKQNIETKYLQNSKNYITNFIINNFVKEFEDQKANKSSFTKTLTIYMNKFKNEFHIIKYLEAFN